VIIDPLQWLLVLGAAFAGAVVGGLGGFGTGVILTVVLVPILGVKATVPTLALAGVVINAGRLSFYRADLDRRVALRVLVGALPLLALGAWLHARLDARPLGIAMGSSGMVVGGAVFGLANGMASGMGVILVSLLLGGGLGGTAVLATDAAVSVVVDLVRAALFGHLRTLDAQGAVLGLLIGVATLPGSAAAAWLVRRMRVRLHALLMEALIVLGGVGVIVGSLREAPGS
jgi:uncharacterized membrane protein YfcA